MSEIDADVVVVGLGALGSATAWQLARRGVRVRGLERFALGHVAGASHGDSRIIRLSYHTRRYVEAARRAYADWADLERDSARSLVTVCGGIDVFPAGAAISPDDYSTAMSDAGVPFDVLDAAGANARFPGFVTPDGATVLFQAQTGIVPATLGTATLQDQARRHGAALRDNCPVVALRDADDGCEVVCADGSTLRAATVVLCADAWTNDLLGTLDDGSGARIPLTVTKEHVVHFDVRGTAERHAQQAFPVWIWMDDPSWYGFPTYGEPTVKVGQDCGGAVVEPDRRTFEPDAEYVARMADFVGRRIPGAGTAVRVTSCLYTLTPDRDFVVDRVPGHPRIVVGLGAAHGFKFAPWFGRVLADLATSVPEVGADRPGVGGPAPDDLSAFSMSRPALTGPAAGERTTWLV